MKVFVAMDSFKGCLTSFEAGVSVREGILSADADAFVTVKALADGGEGTVSALVTSLKGHYETVTVTDPVGRPVKATYGVLPDGTAVIEMAEAAGLALMGETPLNPMTTTTYGVGEIILDAIKKGCRRFIVGIGGSATNDGGVGMLQALGFRFLNRHGYPIARGAWGLQELSAIDDTKRSDVLKECSFTLANDVRNPLCGPDGCSAVYGPQKGATPAMIEQMDAWLSQYASLTKRLYPDSNADLPGNGAGGGIAFAFSAYLHGQSRSGADLVIERLQIAEAVKQADLVITGEGCTDFQTAQGKAPDCIARLAAQYGKPAIILCGCRAERFRSLYKSGVTAVFPILAAPISKEEAMDPILTKKNLCDTAEQVVRLFQTKMPAE